MILQFHAAMNATVVNTLFKKKTNHQATNESVPSKTQIYYCLVMRNQRKFFKHAKVLQLVKCVSPSISYWYLLLR